MTVYSIRVLVTQEAREAIAINLDDHYAQELLNEVAKTGATPISEPSITWVQISETDITLNPERFPHTVRAGDWEVRAKVQVEDPQHIN